MSDQAHSYWSLAAVLIVTIISIASCTAYTDTHRPILSVGSAPRG